MEFSYFYGQGAGNHRTRAAAELPDTYQAFPHEKITLPLRSYNLL